MNLLHARSHHVKISIGVIALSFSPLVVKMVTFTPVVSAFYRSFYAAMFFFIFACIKHRSQFLADKQQWVLPSLIAGLFLGIDLIIWHKTILLLGAGPATFLGNSQIIFVILFAAAVFREKIPVMYFVTVAMVMAGLFMLTPASPVSVSRLKGYLMGITVGFTYAGMLISLRYAKSRSSGRYPEILSLAAVFAVSAAVIAIYAAGFEHSVIFTGGIVNHSVMAAAAFFCQTVGWYIINHSITDVPAHEGSLLLMLQPVLATVWGCIFFSEILLPVQVFGIAVTMAGIIVYQFRNSSAGSVDFEE